MRPPRDSPHSCRLLQRWVICGPIESPGVRTKIVPRCRDGLLRAAILAALCALAARFVMCYISSNPIPRARPRSAAHAPTPRDSRNLRTAAATAMCLRLHYARRSTRISRMTTLASARSSACYDPFVDSPEPSIVNINRCMASYDDTHRGFALRDCRHNSRHL